MKFIDEKVKILCGVLKDNIYSTVEAIDDFEYIECGYKTSNEPPAPDAGWKTFSKGSRVFGKDKHFWFRKKIKTPEKIKGKEVCLTVYTDKEGWDAINPQCIVYLNGHLTQGADVNHREVLLDFDTEYDVCIYFYTGMLSDDCMVDFFCEVTLIDKLTEKVFYDLNVPLNAAMCFDKDSENYIKILKALETAVGYLDFRKIGSEAYYDSLKACEKYMDKEFYNKLCSTDGPSVSCIGHTHIDVAWLWTLAQTNEKAQRSFSTVINLMKQYPEYKFMSSQPQLYKYVKDSAPELYEEIKKAVKDGRWEVEGAMWVEADCNLSSGESFVRQLISGKRFMMDEFGVDSKILWLPDVFGYSAALPQILKKAGVNKFVTSKISWNETNQLPYDTFIWQGIDGTEIFSYFLTAAEIDDLRRGRKQSTYVAYVRPSQILGTWERYQQKQYNTETISTFGFGDGGGGPTKDMLEQQRRLAYGIPGIPATKIEFAGEFLDRVEKNFYENAERLKRMPKWVGELYLEFHRGTYTSLAKNKKNNRKSEFLYQSTETLGVIDELLLNKPYPKKEITDAWEVINLNQFHDIIPGSSIFEVYEDSDKMYKEILDYANGVYEQKISDIASNVKTDGGVLVYNPLSFDCSSVVDIEGEKLYVEDIPAFGYKVVVPKSPDNSIIAEKNKLENKFYSIFFDDNANIISIYDKQSGRELIKAGEKANQLQLFEDYPREYDAWEISVYYKQKMWLIDDVESVEVVRNGSSAGLKITRKYMDSVIVQTIRIYEDIARIDFENEIDWNEDHVLLKSAFPFDINASKATYEIQFGNVERPTHSNTSWDAAKFEVCAHKYADISDSSYGVSILNDCKYGYSTEGSVMKITMLKCATYPNPAADKEHHSFTYSLYPHKGSFADSDVVAQAYILNKPMTAKKLTAQDGCLNDEYSFVKCSDDNVIIETIKKAENSDDTVLRMYESKNTKTSVELNFGFVVKNVYVCDLLENNIEKLDVVDNSVVVPVSNFEIVTLKIER